MKIYYISDLHFDYKTQEEVDKFLSILNDKDLYLFAGDFYNDWTKTLTLIEEMDKRKIHGYWVLGNHEYCWLAEPCNTDPSIKDLKVFKEEDFVIQKDTAYDHFIDAVKKKCAMCKNMKFLDLYDIVNLKNGWRIIGDTAWGQIDIKKAPSFEWNHVHNWKWINKRNSMWNKFLEEQIKRNDKLIVLTHHPLYTPKKFEPKSRFLKKMNGEIQFWFSNKSKKVSKEKSIIFIHGHTHDISYEKNHLTNAIGRKENCFEMKLKSFDIDEKK